MYYTAADWFADNYTGPKGMRSHRFDQEAGSYGLEAQYGRLVGNTLTPHERDNYYGIRQSFYGYLGEILLAGGLNWYIKTFYPQSRLTARLSTLDEDGNEKIDVVLAPDYDPYFRLGFQAKLSKNCQSSVNGTLPVLGIKVGCMNLGMEELMEQHGANPPNLIHPQGFIYERFSYFPDDAMKFADSLMQQAGHILRKTSLANAEKNHPFGGVFRALCGYNF